MTEQNIKNNLLCKLFIVLRVIICIAVLTLIGCGGGFLDDNANANEFKNPIFHPEEVETDTTNLY